MGYEKLSMLYRAFNYLIIYQHFDQGRKWLTVKFRALMCTVPTLWMSTLNILHYYVTHINQIHGLFRITGSLFGKEGASWKTSIIQILLFQTINQTVQLTSDIPQTKYRNIAPSFLTHILYELQTVTTWHLLTMRNSLHFDLVFPPK